MKKIILLTLLATCFCKAQDTIQYTCSVVLNKTGNHVNTLLYESMQLHPGNFVKWTNEYDLRCSEYGKYTIKDNMLMLELYNSKAMDENHTGQCFKVVDSLVALHAKPHLIRYYQISGDNLQFLTLKGKKLKPAKRIYDSSLRKPLGWLFGNGRKYIYRKTDLLEG